MSAMRKLRRQIYGLRKSDRPAPWKRSWLARLIDIKAAHKWHEWHEEQERLLRAHNRKYHPHGQGRAAP